MKRWELKTRLKREELKMSKWDFFCFEKAVMYVKLENLFEGLWLLKNLQVHKQLTNVCTPIDTSGCFDNHQALTRRH